MFPPVLLAQNYHPPSFDLLILKDSCSSCTPSRRNPFRMEQPTLAQACSVSLLTNPSFVIKPEMSTRKHITTSLSGFINPLVWWEVRTHDFLEGHWHDPAPSVAYLPYMDLRTKADVNNSMGFLAKWTTMCFERFGSTVVLSHNHKCLKTHLGPIPLGTLTADYLFTSLAPTRGVSHLTVLETRTPGALECFSSTHGPSYDPRKNDKELDKHARA